MCDCGRLQLSASDQHLGSPHIVEPVIGPNDENVLDVPRGFGNWSPVRLRLAPRRCFLTEARFSDPDFKVVFL